MILDTALAMATEVGLEGLSIGALAKATEMSKSGLFAHFDSKEALQLQILDHAAEHFVETVMRPALAAPRGEPRIRAFFENWYAWSQSPHLPGGCLFVAAATELDDRPGPVRDHLAAIQRRWLDALAKAARIAVEAGQFRADLDPEQFAFDAYAVILGYYHFKRLLRVDNARARASRSFEALLARARV